MIQVSPCYVKCLRVVARPFRSTAVPVANQVVLLLPEVQFPCVGSAFDKTRGKAHRIELAWGLNAIGRCWISPRGESCLVRHLLKIIGAHFNLLGFFNPGTPGASACSLTGQKYFHGQAEARAFFAKAQRLGSFEFRLRIRLNSLAHMKQEC